MGVAHSSWILSLGMLAHIFKRIECKCRLLYLSKSNLLFNDLQRKEIISLRKLHLSTCKLLRDVNQIYSIQILSSLACFFALLAFRCYAIVMHFTKPGVNNLLVLVQIFIFIFIHTFGITI